MWIGFIPFLLQDIQREIRSLQGEIHSMGRAAQELLAVTNADSHDLIRQSLRNLNNRVQTLEAQAKEQGDKLRAVDRNYKSYKVSLKPREYTLQEIGFLSAKVSWTLF